MGRGVIRKAGRRGAMAAAVVALAVAGVGLSAGVASADGQGWYWLAEHPTGHGVGVYAGAFSESIKVAGDLSSTTSTGDEVDLVCEVKNGESVNVQSPVWYDVSMVYSTNYGLETGTAFVYGAYVDGDWNASLLPPC